MGGTVDVEIVRERGLEGQDVTIRPRAQLDVRPNGQLHNFDTSHTGLYQLYRNCSLAVLNSGAYSDDARQMMETFKDFDIRLLQEDRGIRLQLRSAPSGAFVDGKILTGIREHLFSVLRDILYVNADMVPERAIGEETTHAVFDILRNAGVLRSDTHPVWWCVEAVIQFGRGVRVHQSRLPVGASGFDICTGCGDGAMKGPMKALPSARQTAD